MIRISKPIVFGFFCFLFCSCASTPSKPNIPYSGYSPELDKISVKNLVLVIELRKLPELQDGISKKEIVTLKSLIKLYDNAPKVFDTAFDEMYKVGLHDVRKYCSPLQALFWLLEDDKFDLASESIINYDLKWLLVYAWADKKKERWGNYHAVVDRLNYPKLIDYYEAWNFEYRRGTGSRLGHSRLIFKTKKGDCRDYTAFSVKCLNTAGYEAKAIKVVSPSGSAFHVVCEFKENNKVYIIDNSCH